MDSAGAFALCWDCLNLYAAHTFFVLRPLIWRMPLSIPFHSSPVLSVLKENEKENEKEKESAKEKEKETTVFSRALFFPLFFTGYSTVQTLQDGGWCSFWRTLHAWS